MRPNARSVRRTRDACAQASLAPRWLRRTKNGTTELTPVTTRKPAPVADLPVGAASAPGDAIASYIRAEIKAISRRVSPAHAGMVPACDAEQPSMLGLPRPRGDGPLREPTSHLPRRSPPPTRGWSGGPEREDGAARVSPAHAGMVPWRSPFLCARSVNAAICCTIGRTIWRSAGSLTAGARRSAISSSARIRP